MDIIPHILTEDNVRDLTDEHLSMLVVCTTERLMKFIYKYLDDARADDEVHARVAKAYDYTIQRDKFLAAEETKRYSELLTSTDYSMLSVAMTKDSIEELIKGIDYITQSPYAVPYISSVTNSNYNTLKESLTQYLNEFHLTGVNEFLNKFKKYRELFRDGPVEYNRGTVVKKVVRNLQTYEIMRRGLLFILDAKQHNRTYDTWRFL